MNINRAIKIGIATIITTFVIVIILIQLNRSALTELDVLRLMEIFVAIPLLSIIYYLLISAKYEEFSERIGRIEKDFEILVNRLDKGGISLGKEEKVLQREIKELRKISNKISRDIEVVKRRTK